MRLASFNASVLSVVIVSIVLSLIDHAFPQSPPSSLAFEEAEVALRRARLFETRVRPLILEPLRLQISGYLDASYTQNFNNPSNRINQLRIFDVNSNQVRPNLAQFVLERTAEADGWRDRFGFRVKFNAGRDSDFIGGVNLSPWADFQEFYLQYLAPVGHGLDLKLGQINSVIGYEVLESPHNANYSRSWLFGLGQPFTTRGVRGSYHFGDHVLFSLGVISYINSARVDTRNDPLVESAVAVDPFRWLTVTLYGLGGPRPGSVGTEGGNLLLLGGIMSVHPTDTTSVILEAYYANQANSSAISRAHNARWNGVAGYFIYDLTPQWGIHLRAELYEDAGGFTTCDGTTAYQPRANVCFGATSQSSASPVPLTLWEFTPTLQFKPTASWTARLEYRYDKANKDVFQVGGRSISYQPTVSLELLYVF